ncbi:alpha/beta fold hydrolase [Streptomyces sp. NPDC059740]|uniref:alpha/beta fold hydrolase n=1 Tax=Streptomyces sp. NPDC059740 TaxID=3346926 RepID=UPI0036515F73
MTDLTWKPCLDRSFAGRTGEVRWTSLGPADAPPVVLLHGTPFSSYVWRRIAPVLAREHRVYLWDMPGYGTSAMHDGQDVSLAAQGRVFADICEHWGLTEPAVVAHDFGGCVALRARLLHGMRYRRLVLADAVTLAPWGTDTYRHLGEHAAVFAGLPPYLHRALVAAYVPSASHPGLAPATLDALLDPWCTPAGQAAFYRQIAANDSRFTDEVQHRYGEVDEPVLVCWGAEDTWLPPARGRELAALLPDARFRLLPGAGHLVQEDAPEHLAALLDAFLRGRPV